MTLKTVKGVTSTDDGMSYKLFCKSAELVATSKAGIVMSDGETTTVNSSGKMSAKQAARSITGIAKRSKGIKVVGDDAVVVNTNFIQAEDLANIITEEAIATILDKVSKAIAMMMNLNQNTLSKGMLTGIDVSDPSKVPTMAYIHTLTERIGTGIQLTAGDSLAGVVNNLSSNLVAINAEAVLNGAENINGFTATYPDRTDRAFQLQYDSGEIASITFNNTDIQCDFYDGQNWEQVWKFYNPT